MLPSTLRLFLLAMLLTGAWASLSAQTSTDLHRYDEAIQRTYKEDKRDSFLYFTTEKARLARQADSLAIWGWVQYRIQKFFSDTPAEALRRIDLSFQAQWRTPRNAEEAEPMLYLWTYQADYFLKQGLLVSAVGAGEKAATLFEQYRYSDFDATESVYKSLGNNYTRLGDNEKALAIFQKALLLGGSDEQLSGLYNNIGIACWNSGDYPAAALHFRKGLALKQVSNTRRGLLLAGLAQLQLDHQQAPEACRTADDALALLRRDPRSAGYLSSAYRTAGEAWLAVGRYPEADRLLALAEKQALNTDQPPRDRGKIALARAQLALRRADASKAIAAANDALRMVLPHFKPVQASDNPASKDFYEENVIFEALKMKADAAELLYHQNSSLSWLYVALDCHDLAWAAEMRLREVFQYRSSKLGLQYAARVREEAAMRIAHMLYEQSGDPALILRGFAIAERSKDMLLRDALQENIAQRQQQSGDARFDELRMLRRNVAYVETQMLQETNSDQMKDWRQMTDGLMAQINALERILKASYPDWYEKHANNSDYALLEGIPAHGLLLEYFVTSTFVDVFVCAPDRALAWHRLPNDQPLRDLVARYLSYFQEANTILSNPDAYFQTAYSLWQQLLPPEVASADHLTIVPDGFVNFIPFEALLCEAPKAGQGLRTAPYLLRKQHLFYAWSLSTLRRQNELKSVDVNQLLGIAPGFTHGERGMAPLPSSGEEWRGMEHYERVELHAEQATTAEMLRHAGAARILHFSTHAFAGEMPRIELFDHALLLPDIYTLPIQADLVVLSACQTGLGKEQKGEGIMSLARAFASSGAACVVSSLWSVNDRSTAYLFSRFYFHLSGGSPTGDALRQAKLDYLDDPAVSTVTQSPYFWAGFLAIGAEREMQGASSFFSWKMLAGLVAVLAVLAVLFYFRYPNRWRIFD